MAVLVQTIRQRHVYVAAPVEVAAPTPVRLTAVQPLWPCDPAVWPASDGAPERRRLTGPASVTGVRPTPHASPLASSPLPPLPPPSEALYRAAQRSDVQAAAGAAGTGTRIGSAPLPVWSSPPTPTEPTAADGGPACSPEFRRVAGPVPGLLQSSARVQQLRSQLAGGCSGGGVGGGGGEAAGVPVETVQPEDLSPRCATNWRPARHWKRPLAGSVPPPTAQPQPPPPQPPPPQHPPPPQQPPPQPQQQQQQPQQQSDTEQTITTRRETGQAQRTASQEECGTQTPGGFRLTRKDQVQTNVTATLGTGNTLRSLLMSEAPREVDKLETRTGGGEIKPDKPASEAESASRPQNTNPTAKTGKRSLPAEYPTSGKKKAKREATSDKESLSKPLRERSTVKPQPVDSPAPSAETATDTSRRGSSSVESGSARTDAPAPPIPAPSSATVAAAATATAGGSCSRSDDRRPSTRSVSSDDTRPTRGSPAAPAAGDASPMPPPRSMKARILALVHQENSREEGKEEPPAADPAKSGAEQEEQKHPERSSSRRRGGSASNKRVTANMVVKKVETGELACFLVC